MTQNKKTVAVFFGARSPEHDVSIITGLQILKAIDPSRYDAFPVYLDPQGTWYVGDALSQRSSYMLTPETIKSLTKVTLDMNRGKRCRLLPVEQPFLGKAKPIEFDIAMPAFHGLNGEDGRILGAFEMANVPYAGMRMTAAAISMDKALTKELLRGQGIPCLPHVVLRRPDQGTYIDEDTLKEIVGDLKFPVIVKPVHLGSSIGVAKAKDIEELSAALPSAFELDDTVLLEPFVPNMIEYNASVARMNGEVVTSAIERPKNHEELLDFKQKYMSGGGSKSGKLGGSKNDVSVSEGMLSLTRELNPDISAELSDKVKTWATALFETIGGTGAPRIDFIGDSKSGELWVNEINPFPGSIGYFLWEALPEPLLFSELLSHLLEEAIECKTARILPTDPVPVGARLFKRAH